ncbi:Peptidase M48 [Gracilaria domingensis]|nr:Peptidase M48 [Gracilaria domingensis]
MAFVAPFVTFAAPTRTSFVSTQNPARLIRPSSRFCRRSTIVSSSASSATNSINSISSRVRFPSLRPDQFRHPIDVRATRVLKSLFGLEWILRSVLQTAEQMLFFENISTGVRVTAKQYPSMHTMLQEACEVLDVPVPQLYVRQNPVPNAYTLAVQGNKPFIVVHSSLIELVTPQELQAVLAHELGHLKSEHGVWVTMANLLLLLSSSTLGNTLGSIVYEVLNRQLLAWQRAAELTCDRAMLLVMQDKNVAMSALMKLTGGVSKYSDEMDLDEFLAQADQFDEESKTGLGNFLRQSMTLSSTHPLPILRARELKRWSESNHFQSLLRSGKPLRESS